MRLELRQVIAETIRGMHVTGNRIPGRSVEDF
jgi:hypothetical protein